MPFTQPPLPFAPDALEPYGMKAETFEYHYGKHHKAYVDNLNKLTEGTELADKSLEEVIQISFKDPSKAGIFNNAAQVWNHDFYWESLAPNGGGTPPEPMLKRLESTFGSFDNFRDKFVEASVNQFGSGWAWLVVRNGKLEITTTHDADNPLTHGDKPLWTCDVWEHAYYLDYQHERARFVKTVIEKLANWQFVGKQLADAER